MSWQHEETWVSVSVDKDVLILLVSEVALALASLQGKYVLWHDFTSLP